MRFASLNNMADTVCSMGDITYVLLLLVVIWLAISFDGGGGGGRRARIPVGAS